MLKNTFFLWILSIFITLFCVFYQRVTGPTYPLKGHIQIEKENISFKLYRSHSGKEGHHVKILTENPVIQGKLLWKRYPIQEDWKEIAMQREGKYLFAVIPNQPPAGKVEYKVFLASCFQNISLSGDRSIILRFKGEVPLFYLIPHIILIFAGMLFSMRSGLEALCRNKNTKILALYSILLIFLGGIVFGAIIQYYAFGAFWTGFPVGNDLTDTKTLIAFLFWIFAIFQMRNKKDARWWIFIASMVTLVVYFIPHSLLGSELDYTKSPS